MPRAPHPHVCNGIYGVLLGTHARSRLFHEAADQRVFEDLLADSLVRYGARLHAYAWLEGQAKLVIQVDETPVGRVVHQLVTPYTRHVNRRHGLRGRRFGHAYRSVLLNGTVHLPELVRHMHLSPVAAGLARDPTDYPASSHRAYLGRAQVPWLTTDLVLGLLGEHGWRGRDGFARFVARGDDPGIVEGHGMVHHTSDYTVVDDAAFCRWLRQPQTRRHSLERIVEGVCRLLQVEPQDLDGSARPALPVARALIASHATQSAGIALSVVAKRLHRHPSTLLVAIRRHRALRPRLFAMSLRQLLDGEKDPGEDAAAAAPPQRCD